MSARCPHPRDDIQRAGPKVPARWARNSPNKRSSIADWMWGDLWTTRATGATTSHTRARLRGVESFWVTTLPVSRIRRSIRFAKQEVLALVTHMGLHTRRGMVLNPQSFALILRNPLYMGTVASPESGISGRGKFDPLISEETFYRVQSILSGRVVVSGPRQRNHPDFPLRGFVRCEACGRSLTGSWSKGRNGHYAYYHCQPRCRAVYASKERLESVFVDELRELQPSAGYMRLVKDRIILAWRELRDDARSRAAEIERRLTTIQQKLDRLDEAFLYEQSIDIDTYDRQKDRLKEQQTLAQIDRHSTQLEQIDVEGILGFAERILPGAADLWVQASLDQKQRLQQLFYPEGVAFDGNRFNRTTATAPLFKYLEPAEGGEESLVGAAGIEPATPRV